VGGAGEAVPVVGVGERALLAVEVGVDGHGVGGLELVDEGVGAGPVAVRVPPQGFEGRGQVGRRGGGGEGGGEGGGRHRGYVLDRLRCELVEFWNAARTKILERSVVERRGARMVGFIAMGDEDNHSLPSSRQNHAVCIF